MAEWYAPTVYSIGDLIVDVGRRRVKRGEDELKLAKLTFDLLVTLAERAPFLVTHDEIAENVWPGRVVSPEVIAQRVKILRRSLGDNAEEPRYIRVARGQGYQLIPNVNASTSADGSMQPIDGVEYRFGDSALTPSWRRRASLIAALMVGAVLAGTIVWYLKPEQALESARVQRFIHPIPERFEPSLPRYNPLAISPDGRRIAYTTFDGLYLRDFSELDARRILETDFGRIRGPFFAPDGQSISYSSQGGMLERIAIDGDAPMIVADQLTAILGVSWEPGSESILFASFDGVYRVSANGGTSELVFELRAGELIGTPHLLPDGDTVLMAVTDNPGEPIAVSTMNWNVADIVAQSISTGERKLLIEGGSHPRYVPTGYLIYAYENTLRGVAFDVETLTVSGATVTVVQDVQRGPNIAPFSYFDLSDEGTLAYVRDGYLQTFTAPVWIDREGGQQAINAPAGSYWFGQLSPDGTRILFQRDDSNAHAWIFDVERETSQRLTLGSISELSPIWIDNERIAFRRPGVTADIYINDANGSGVERRLTRVTEGAAVPSDISPDGTSVIYNRIATQNAGIWSIPIDAVEPSPGEPILDSPVQEWNARISPDGRWLAYQSDESGRFEVYVRPYSDLQSRRIEISRNGGTHPQWSRDGSELYYLSLPQSESGMYGEVFQRFRTGALMAVSVETDADFTPGPPEKLFENIFVAPGWMHHAYDVAPDGRFLMFQRRSQDDRGIIIVKNWIEELKRLVPTD